ncbi:MAG: V-type ATP synthase subunit F [Lachnospiraceae bacterium]|jgi:V/A-type H+-transporting ATPase subunit F|nr:V-type ATP synthase subunit F [Lachnospiraceae bacterium]
MANNEQAKIAVVGDRESVMLFGAVGIRCVYASTQREAETAVGRLAREGCAVIYITEQVADMIPETLKRYKTETFPALIPIPNREGSSGLGMRGIRANLEKAIGADILFGEGR